MTPLVLHDSLSTQVRCVMDTIHARIPSTRHDQEITPQGVHHTVRPKEPLMLPKRIGYDS